MLPVMQVGRVRPGAPPEHDVLHPVGGGLGQARPTNNIGIHGTRGDQRTLPNRVESSGCPARVQAIDSHHEFRVDPERTRQACQTTIAGMTQCCHMQCLQSCV
ncbi:MAG: hypothetical protein FJ404_10285 [Verrucomicrobia bacterium]|nr:hypothetical protein [Verrucomicrobiota bacterium]